MSTIHPVQQEQYGSYLWLKREVGFALGLPRDDGAWKHSDHGRVESIVQSGYYQFCYPPPLEPAAHRGGDNVEGEASEKDESRRDARERMPHSWSFLRGLESLDFVSGKYEYDAPEDFTGIVGDLVVDSGEGRLPVVSEEHLRALLAKNNASGTPQYVAMRPKRSNNQGEQRWEVIVYPRPDKAASVTFRYTITPTSLGNAYPFPLGGRQHAETILASCLAIAEEREGAIKNMQPGTYGARFMQRLAASIHLDKQAGKASDSGTWKQSDGNPAEDIKRLVGDHMGFGQNSDAWTEIQLRQAEEAMRRGLRRFYVPVPIPGQKRPHNWSFLNPTVSLNLTAGKFEYDLPEDFGQLDSPLTYAPGTNALYPDVEVVAEAQVRRLLQASVQANGRPIKVAKRVKAGLQEGGTRYELVFWPVPDDDYHLEYTYSVSPGDTLSVIHGGSAHYQTILEACLCEADLMLKRRYRHHEERFMERLIASVHYDQSLASPKSLGYNRDNSDGASSHLVDDLHRMGYAESGVTYNGVRY